MIAYNSAIQINKETFFSEIGYFWTKFNDYFTINYGLVVNVLSHLITYDGFIYKYHYVIDGESWWVYDAPPFKLTFNESHTYHCFFSKMYGTNVRFGQEINIDPPYCGLGPEILDLEVSVNGCVPVPGSTNCRYCYKNNTNASPTNMSFDTFKQIIDKFPKNLSQIAFGITGLQTNPDLSKMFEYCRDIGVIPNVTTVGADLTDDMKNMLCKYCGAVAVSCYTGAKDLCYKTIKELKNWAANNFRRNLHVNMHIVISKDNMNHLKDVLNDIKDGKLPELSSIVLLRIKPKGRASKMDCRLSKQDYREIIKFCLNNHISFGFDSCSAYMVGEVLKEIGREDQLNSIEPCESGLFSSYINVKGEYWNCSFAEGLSDFIEPINVLEYSNLTDWWMNNIYLKKIRKNENPACKSCPIYNLDEMT